ncbi:MAG: hypothetical protein ACK5LL_13825, partial [Suipraeoptans sp.]
MTKNRIPQKTTRRKKKSDIVTAVIGFFNNNTDQSYNYKQIGADIGIKTQPERLLLMDILEGMVEDAFIIETRKGKYKSNTRGLFLEGRFERRSSGKNFFVPDEEGAENVFVAERNSAHAMNGDKVRIQMLARRKGKDPEGEVVEILERKHTRFVGTLNVQQHFAFLEMDSKILANDIFIP